MDEWGRGARVALGMSGGVDSAVAAIVLMRAGYRVVGVTCLFCEGDASDGAARAREVCDALGIAHEVRDCRAAFERRIVGPFVEAYGRCLTPSPCVECNARVKIPELVVAADDLGCDLVATGHYARIAQLLSDEASREATSDGRYVVKRALDARKDQSYMLALLDQQLLSRLLLPMGGLTKTEARIIAAEAGLPVADEPDSQDICFAPQGYRGLLAQRGVPSAPGPIVDISGAVVGRHDGLENYTIGQRKGIGVAADRPYYVIGKRIEDHALIVGFEEQSLISGVTVADPVWQAYRQPPDRLEAMVKLRYRSEPVACIITVGLDGCANVELRSPQPTTAPGQYAVFTMGDTVLGCGMIEEVERVCPTSRNCS